MDLAQLPHEVQRTLGPGNLCTVMRCRDTAEGAFMVAVLAVEFLVITVAALLAATATVAVTRTAAGEAEAMEAAGATAEAGAMAEEGVANFSYV